MIFLGRQTGEASCQPMPTIVPVEVFPDFLLLQRFDVEVCLENDDDDHCVLKHNLF